MSDNRITFSTEEQRDKALIRAALAISLIENLDVSYNIGIYHARQIVAKFHGIQTASIGKNWKAYDEEYNEYPEDYKYSNGRRGYWTKKLIGYSITHVCVNKLYANNVNLHWLETGEGHMFNHVPSDMLAETKWFRIKKMNHIVDKYALHTEHEIGKYIIGGREIIINRINDQYKMTGEDHHDQDILKRIMNHCESTVVRESYAFMDFYGQRWIMDDYDDDTYISIKTNDPSNIKYPAFISSMLDMERMVESTDNINEEVFYKEAM